jgi:hypothetical protein
VYVGDVSIVTLVGMMNYTSKQANKLFDSLIGGGAIAFLFLVWVATMPHISKSP